MFLNPFKNVAVRPKFCSWIRCTRGIRPQIKIAKEKFEISLDLHQFKKEEIRVKALPEYVIIEGKLERKTKRGEVVKQFVRKFRLPDGCCPSTIKSELSSDGILTITAPRKTYDSNLPCETVIPISYSGPRRDKDDSILPVTDTASTSTNNATTTTTSTENATTTTTTASTKPGTTSDVKPKK